MNLERLRQYFFDGELRIEAAVRILKNHLKFAASLAQLGWGESEKVFVLEKDLS
jgi:hypothetical protein